MLLLAVCILFNAYIAIVFKYFEKYEIRNLQAIIVNYFVCAITASFVMRKPAITLDIFEKEWLLAAILLGLTFVIVFNLFAVSVQKFGIVLSSIFQKMSLVAPAIIAIIFYGESASWIKVLGICLAIISIVVISFKRKNKNEIKDAEKMNPLLWIFPIGTFIGSCFIDTGLFYVNKTGLANSNDIDFIATLFFFGGVFGTLFVIYDYFKNGVTIRKKDFVAGIGLGIPNFFSIYLLLMVLSNGMDASVVFPINNVGILVFAAILGRILFKEYFTSQKVLGFVLAIIAIALLANG